MSLTIQQVFEVALHHHQAGRLAEAETLYRQILTIQPKHADALHLLGVIAHQIGQYAVAVDLIKRAIAQTPGYPAFHSNLGESYRMMGQLDEAITAFREAIAIEPNYADAHYNLGIALAGKEQVDEAIASYRKAIALRPDLADVHSNLGIALSDKGRLDDAIASFRLAITLKPDDAVAYSNLGNALRDKGQLDDAIAAGRQAVALRPSFAEAHNNIGNSMYAKGYLDEAIAAFRQAISFKPNYAEAHGNLGNALKEMGQLNEAITAYRHTIALKPSYADAHSNLALALHYPSNSDARTIAEEHKCWDRIHAGPLVKFIQPHTNDREDARRLRVGYVSPDFREHSVAYFLEGLFSCHDREQVEVVCYSNVARPDAVTARLRRLVPRWREIANLPDARAAELIRDDKIDILVDMAGHTARNRLPLFARKPAPVQVTWLGYPDTTGLQTMDYRLTDALADPPGTTECLHTEQLFRLPNCAWCFHPSELAPPVSAPPLQDSGHITFGCFGTLAKISERLMSLWSDILLAVPGSHFLLKNLALREASTQHRIQAIFGKLGIAPERIELAAHAPNLADHLTSYRRVDIALDTFPYHGTASTCEALWMGVPIIALEGRTHVSRVGVSLLTNVGLSELIAGNSEEYVAIATALGRDAARLAALRATLRERMAASPLMDSPRFARNMEQAFRTMWRHWCGKPS